MITVVVVLIVVTVMLLVRKSLQNDLRPPRPQRLKLGDMR